MPHCVVTLWCVVLVCCVLTLCSVDAVTLYIDYSGMSCRKRMERRNGVLCSDGKLRSSRMQCCSGMLCSRCDIYLLTLRVRVSEPAWSLVTVCCVVTVTLFVDLFWHVFSDEHDV